MLVLECVSPDNPGLVITIEAQEDISHIIGLWSPSPDELRAKVLRIRDLFTNFAKGFLKTIREEIPDYLTIMEPLEGTLWTRS